MLGNALLVFISMAVRDCLGATSTAFIAEHRRFLAGLFDGFCDLCGIVSFGGATEVMLQNGYGSVEFLLTASAVVLGSQVGTYLGIATSTMIDKTFPMSRPVVALKETTS